MGQIICTWLDGFASYAEATEGLPETLGNGSVEVVGINEVPKSGDHKFSIYAIVDHCASELVVRFQGMFQSPKTLSKWRSRKRRRSAAMRIRKDCITVVNRGEQSWEE